MSWWFSHPPIYYNILYDATGIDDMLKSDLVIGLDQLALPTIVVSDNHDFLLLSHLCVLHPECLFSSHDNQNTEAKCYQISWPGLPNNWRYHLTHWLTISFHISLGGFYRPLDEDNRVGGQVPPYRERRVPMTDEDDVDKEHVLYAKM